MSIAYLDPGNIESDLQSGSVAQYRYRYLHNVIKQTEIDIRFLPVPGPYYVGTLQVHVQQICPDTVPVVLKCGTDSVYVTGRYLYVLTFCAEEKVQIGMKYLNLHTADPDRIETRNFCIEP